MMQFLGCNSEEEFKAFWLETYPCSGFHIPCSDFNNYFTGGYVARICGADGVWSTPDYSSCIVKSGVGSFALLWMTFSTSSEKYVISRLSEIIISVSATTILGTFINIITYVFIMITILPLIIRVFLIYDRQLDKFYSTFK